MTATFFEYLGWVSLSPNLKESFNKALLDAEQHRHSIVEIEHLLFALIDDPEGAIALTQKGIDRDELRDEIANHLDAIPAGAKLELSALQPVRELKKLMAKASDQADNELDDHIDGGDVIRALADFSGSDIGDLGGQNYLRVQQSNADASQTPKRHARTRARKSIRAELASPQTGDKPVENTPPNQNTDDLNFDVDPIRASIKAIMARRRDAEEILFECEWYHLFKSLTMIDEVLEGEEQTQRANLLARAEKELAERPRCRKAFLYVRHLDQELARLKGIVDIDWAGEITPDEAVSELARLRAMPPEKISSALSSQTPTSHRTQIGKKLIDVKIQESEVLALEQKLLRLDRNSGFDQNHLEELENSLETHDTHSKKRENVISELERYLNSEMQMADARDHRIIELEKNLNESQNISDVNVDKASNLETELAAFKEHAGNREMLISDLEAKLKTEMQSAEAHEHQLGELRTMLTTEKERAKTHDKLVEELQTTFEDEKKRALDHEHQVRNLETDLSSRLEQLQTRETQVKKLEADLSAHESMGDQHMQELHSLTSNHKQELQELVTNIADQDAESRIHQQEINALRAQLAGMETRLQDQETAYSVEKVNLASTIEQLRLDIEESESLIEIIHATGEPYTLNSNHDNSKKEHAAISHRRTIPIPAKPKQ